MVRISRGGMQREHVNNSSLVSRIRLGALNGAFQGGGPSRAIANPIDNKPPRGYTIRAYVTVQQ